MPDQKRALLSFRNSKMSEVDEAGVLADLIKNCERFVAEKVAGLTREVKATRDKNRDLEKRVIALESERDRLSNQVNSLTKQVNAAEAAQDIPQKRCMDTIQNAFFAAYTASVSDSIMPLTSTPQQLPMTIPETELMRQPQRKRPCFQRIARTATASLITNLDDLDPEFKEQIQPFYTPGNNTTMSDLLNDCQRAFVKYQANKIFKTNDKLTTILVGHIIKEGVDKRLWPQDFRVESGKEFTTYLLTRLKNEKKRLKLRALKGEQNERLKALVDDSCNSDIDSSRLDVPDTSV